MRTTKFAAGVALAALVAVSAACTADSGDDEANEPTPTGSSEAKAADDSLEPVTVGFHNLEGGAISLADVRLGFEAGVEYINAELEGINGHPLEFIDCKTDGTPESSTNCANTFVEDGAVLAVQGADFGADAMLPVLKEAKVAALGAFPLTPGMNAAVGDAYFMQGSAEEGYGATLVQLNNLGAERIAFVMVENPASHATFDDVISPAAERLGVEVKVFYVPQQADWTVQSATVLAWEPDGIATYVAAEALGAIPAFKTGGFEGYITAGSNIEIVPQLDGALLEKVLFSASYYLPEFADIPDEVQSDIDAFTRYTADLDEEGSITQRQTGFYTALMAAQLVRDVSVDEDTVTAELVYDGAKTWSGDREPFRTNGWDCANPSWPGTTACGTGNVYASADEDGVLAPLPDQPVDISAILP